ncbi:hypothetical protein [Sessilibacter corallicola]|uniref:hypothetical protein n=1 Tax=Sessilibacter corallicola TaxID=2904075 RepID=UPI001E3BB406|nr:hypothetical protein [Sessilibacter corallicola]MCE2029467.1 hypothetical protein [Sessilibacter corallicola]
MKRAIIIIFLALLCSCDSGVEWRDEPYEVIWTDTGGNRTLNYEISKNASIGRVKAEVIAVGSNVKYVVAKQKSIDNGSISYFYIDREKDDKHLNGDEIAQGPFSEARFLQIKVELGLPEFNRKF